MQDHLTATEGEIVDDVAEEPIAAHIETMTPGTETMTVDVTPGELKRAVVERLPDDYDSVILITDGKRVVVADHRYVIDPDDDDVPRIENLGQGVSRVENVNRGPDTVASEFDREYLVTTLDQYDLDETVTLYLDEDRPVIIDGTHRIGLAPIATPSSLPGGPRA